MTGLSSRESDKHYLRAASSNAAADLLHTRKDSVSSPSLYWSVLGGNSFLLLSPSEADCSCHSWVIWWYICVLQWWKNTTIVNSCLKSKSERRAGFRWGPDKVYFRYRKPSALVKLLGGLLVNSWINCLALRFYIGEEFGKGEGYSRATYLNHLKSKTRSGNKHEAVTDWVK